MSDLSVALEVGASAAAIFTAIRAASSTIVRTPQYSTKVIAGWGGNLKRATSPGLSFKQPYPLESVAFTTDQTLQVTDFDVNVKTKDDNFIDLPIQIHYEISDAMASARLPDPKKRTQVMQTLAQNVIRGHFAEGNLQDVYRSRNEMAGVVRQELVKNMEDYGLTIRDVVVENPKLPENLQKSMQAVAIAARNLETSRFQADAVRVSAVAQAEAEQAVLIAKANGEKAQLLAKAEGEGAILVAKAEAEKRARTALGEGTAAEQIAIAEGLSSSVEHIKKSGLTAQDALHYIQDLNNRQLERQVSQAYAEAYGKIPRAVLFADTPNTSVGRGDGAKTGSSSADVRDLAKMVLALQTIMKTPETAGAHEEPKAA
jgi:regulator of protease activity HflC (stomatin/prohibitin superfamily)